MQKTNWESSLIKYRIFETNHFIKEFKKLDKYQKEKLQEKLMSYIYPQLVKEPHFGLNIKKLINWKPETWRYRIGKYRFFYEIEEKEKIIFIITLDTRQKIYEKR